MAFKVLRAPIRSTDVDSKEVLLVPLANTDKVAKIFPKDWDRSIALRRYRAQAGEWCRCEKR